MFDVSKGLNQHLDEKKEGTLYRIRTKTLILKVSPLAFCPERGKATLKSPEFRNRASLEPVDDEISIPSSASRTSI